MKVFLFVSTLLLSTLLTASNRAYADFPFGTANTIVDSVNAMIEQDSFTFTAASTDRMFVRMTVTSGTLQPALGIGLGAGQGIGPVFEFVDSGIFVQANNSYTVVTPYQLGGAIGVGSGNYRLYFQSAANPVGALALAYGQTISGNITIVGQIDTYTFDGEEGDEVRLVASRVNGLLDPRPRTFSGSPNTSAVLGTQIIPSSGNNPNSLDTPSSTRNYILPKTGKFVVLLDDTDDQGTPAHDNIETGEYTIALSCISGSCSAQGTPTPTPAGETPTPTATPEGISLNIELARTLVGQALSELISAKKKLPPKPNTNISPKQKKKINMQRAFIITARKILKGLTTQLKLLEQDAGTEIRASVATFDNKTLVDLEKAIRTGSSAKAKPALVKKSWKAVAKILAGFDQSL